MELPTLFSFVLIVGVMGAPKMTYNLQDGRIVNGTDASPGEFPYQISLQYDNEHSCGGTILTNKWILTAAHCVHDEIATYFSVLAGTNVLSSGGERKNVLRYIKHEEYDPEDEHRNDIAVVELESSLSMTGNMKAVTLPTQDQSTSDGLPATVIGWGLLYTGGPSSDTLKKVVLDTWTDEDCSSKLPGLVKPTNICAGVPGGGKGHCSGDSGGPMMVDGYQAGIVSWSVKPCAQPPYPGVYTEVAHYVNWINSKIN